MVRRCFRLAPTCRMTLNTQWACWVCRRWYQHSCSESQKISEWLWGKDTTPLFHLSSSPTNQRKQRVVTVLKECMCTTCKERRVWRVCTSMCWWLGGTGTNWGSLLLSHMVTSRFMFTANGSKPSCRPQMVKYLRVLTSLPKFILATWQTPRLQTGIKPADGYNPLNFRCEDLER